MSKEARMATLGQLERSVMELAWSSDTPLTAYELRDDLARSGDDRTLAATTVLTVLSRLEKKGFVRADRSARPHRYVAVASRAEHMAVLERFIGGVSHEDAAVLRQLLERA